MAKNRNDSAQANPERLSFWISLRSSSSFMNPRFSALRSAWTSRLSRACSSLAFAIDLFCCDCISTVCSAMPAKRSDSFRHPPIIVSPARTRIPAIHICFISASPKVNWLTQHSFKRASTAPFANEQNSQNRYQNWIAGYDRRDQAFLLVRIPWPVKNQIAKFAIN